MNKIYKVIWSKVKHQYVVVSELAHSNGKQSRTAKRSLRSRIAALVVCGAIAAFGVFGALPMEQAFADGAQTTQSQYIAIGDANREEATSHSQTGHWEGSGWDKEWVYDEYYKTIDGHTYVYTETETEGAFWVREGYTIEVVDNAERFTGAGGPDKDIIINAYRGDGADTDDLVQSYQNVQESMNIHTLNGEELFSTNTSMYGGAVNTPTTGVTVVNPNDPNTLNEFIINEGTTALKGTTMIDVTGKKKSSYFQPVNYDSKTGLYHFGSISSSDNIVSTENLYVIDGIVGVFTKTPGGSSINDVYTGDVYGRNNEILMTGVDDNGNYVSYWGAEIIDPNAPIGSMPMSTLQGKFDEVEADIAKIHKDDISEIQVNHTEDGTAEDGKGGTIGLATNGGAMIPGGITVTSEATTGEDTKIKFENNKGSFTVNAGSRVEGTTGEASGETLTGLSINGVDYQLGGGKSVTRGSINNDGSVKIYQGNDDTTGIELDGKIHDYALDTGALGNQTVTADNNGQVTLTVKDQYGNGTDKTLTINGLVTEDNLGEQIKAKNNLTVTEGTTSGADGGNWQIEDSKQPGKIFKNTTLVSKEITPPTSGYENTYDISDTDGNTVTLKDVASAPLN